MLSVGVEGEEERGYTAIKLTYKSAELKGRVLPEPLLQPRGQTGSNSAFRTRCLQVQFLVPLKISHGFARMLKPQSSTFWKRQQNEGRI
jgi:hypothetical protein